MNSLGDSARLDELPGIIPCPELLPAPADSVSHGRV